MSCYTERIHSARIKEGLALQQDRPSPRSRVVYCSRSYLQAENDDEDWRGLDSSGRSDVLCSPHGCPELQHDHEQPYLLVSLRWLAHYLPYGAGGSGAVCRLLLVGV